MRGGWPVGKTRSQKSIVKEREAPTPKVKQLKPTLAKTGVQPGDMVVVPSGDVGLLMDLQIRYKGAAVMFVNNGPWHYYNWQNLKRATMAEIEAAGLLGIGCNQAYD